MQPRFVRLPRLALAAALLLAVPAVETAAPSPAFAEDFNLSLLQKRAAKIKTAAQALQALGQKEAPADLGAKQKAHWEKQSQMYLERAAQLLDWCGKFEKLIEKLKAKTADAKEAQSLSLAFLDVQLQMDAESKAFNTLSNASKARHDVALNAIRNMK